MVMYSQSVNSLLTYLTSDVGYNLKI